MHKIPMYACMMIFDGGNCEVNKIYYNTSTEIYLNRDHLFDVIPIETRKKTTKIIISIEFEKSIIDVFIAWQML